MAETKTVFVQNWEESERGWGTRPDGWTIHSSLDQLRGYVKWFNKTFNNKDEAPDEYTRTDGEPIEVEVEDGLFKKIHKATQRKHPESGRIMNAVHGKGRMFSTRPMRPIKDIDVDWPEEVDLPVEVPSAKGQMKGKISSRKKKSKR